MTKQGVLHLETYRLAGYQARMECPICGEPNNPDMEHCRRCHAPLALAEQAVRSKAPPRMTAALGAAGAGKTVYLGMLIDMLSRAPGGARVSPRGAFSLALQERVMASLRRCRFPDKTPNEPDRWDWLHCQVSAPRRKPVDVLMPDMSGEALQVEISHPNAYPVVRSFLSKCAGLMVLIDAAQLEDGEAGQEFFTMKIVSYLRQLGDDRRRDWRKRPVSIIFTKADLCESCFDDPAEYARKHTPSLYRQCQEYLKNARFFACGVCGATVQRWERGARVLTPARIEPRGIVDPFLWLWDRIT